MEEGDSLAPYRFFSHGLPWLFAPWAYSVHCPVTAKLPTCWPAWTAPPWSFGRAFSAWSRRGTLQRVSDYVFGYHCQTMCFFLGVKRIGRRLLYGSGFHAAQRSSARSLALPLAGASRQNATDRTVRRVRAP